MARDAATIQADIAKATTALNAAVVAHTQADAAVIATAAVVTNAQVALDALNKELAALPPVHEAMSPDGTVVRPVSGHLIDQKGSVWAINAQGKNTKDGAVVASSQDVLKLVIVYADGPGLRQQNAKGDWWTQPLDGTAGKLTTAPGAGPVVTPPVVIPPPVIVFPSGVAPITGSKRSILIDTFVDLRNFNERFPGKTVGDTYGYAYGDRGVRDGIPLDQSFAFSAAYPPAAKLIAAGKMQPLIKLLPGGGVQLNTCKNPVGPGTDWRSPQGRPDSGNYFGSWLWSKIQFAIDKMVAQDGTTVALKGLEFAIEQEVPDFTGGKQIGSWPADWFINIQNWQETDMTDGQWCGPKYPGRMWMAGGGTGSQAVDGVVTPGRHVLNHVWEPNRFRFGWDGKIVNDWKGSAPLPMYLGLQNLIGGWDGNNNPDVIKAGVTTRTVYSVKVWALI